MQKLISFLVFLLISQVSFSQEAEVAQQVEVAQTEAPQKADLATQNTVFNYFYQMGEEVPTIKIQTDLSKLIKQKNKEEYQPGTFSFMLNGQEVNMTAKVRARGNVRKKVCYYPPLKIDFKESELDDNGLDTLDKIKLVLQCKTGKYATSDVFKEHLVYQIHGLLDTNCYRTKLVKFEMWNGEELEKTLDGFLIEHEKEYAKRLNARILDAKILAVAAMEREAYLKMVFFQYMIANTDWAITNKHNVEMVIVPNAKLVTPVPYDFDYSGFVGTGYAVPSEKIPIEKVSQRYFQGFKITEAEAIKTAEFYNSKKDEIFAMVDNANYMDEKAKKSSRHFLNSFFDQIQHPKVIKRNFVND